MSNERKRLPGSEKLTRPEDIKALSKYLGDIKKTQEEHTTLDKDNLEVPGRTTGRLPEIQELPGNLENLDTDIESGKLDDTRITLTTSGKNPKLSKYVLNLEDLKNNSHLDTRRENLDISEKITGLENNIQGLSKENINDLTLRKERIGLEANDTESLEESRLGLVGETKTSALDNYLEELNTYVSDISLTEGTIGLDSESPNIESLESTSINLEAPNQIDLENGKINLGDLSEVEHLGYTTIKIDQKAGVELEGEVVTLEQTSPFKPSLDRTVIDLEANDNASLDNTVLRIDASSGQVSSLTPDQGIVIEREDGPKLELDNSVINLDSEQEESNLSYYIDKLEDENEPDVNGSKVSLEVGEGVVDLYDSVISGPSEKEVDLSKTKKNLAVSGIDSLEDNVLSLGKDNKELDEIYDSSLIVPENPDHEGWNKKELYDSLMMAPDDQKYIKALEMANSLGPWGKKISSLISSVLSNDYVSSETASWFDSELKKILKQMGVLSNFDFSNSGEKAKDLEEGNAELEIRREGILKDPTKNSDLMPLSKDTIQMPVGVDERNGNGVNDHLEAAEEAMVMYEKPSTIFSKDENKRGYKTIPEYKLPDRGILDSLNISNYLRFGVEELFNLWNPSTKAERLLKPTLLNEALALLVIAREKLEILAKSNRDRLPGDDAGFLSDLVSGGASGAVGNLIDNSLSNLKNVFSGAKSIDKQNPINRPETKLVGGKWERQETVGFNLGNTRQETTGKSKKEVFGESLVKSLIGNLGSKNSRKDINFYEKYIYNFATLLTLEDLCDFTPEKVESLEGLKEVLKNSQYITTPSRFGTIQEGKYGTMTLDTNAFWEVVIEPFCHGSMNGGYSFLPAIEEINVINESHFGVKTNYSGWLPIMSFELQKSKLTNKSLGLYDGEIVYPVTSELSNEFRMTIADDQYKSWKTYFQKCADVSVYSSEAHTKGYYKSTENIIPTVVDKTRPIVALYKNITFLIKIYIMTPQYSTVRRFQLLCVLKDFEESYSGDIDAGGYDLNLSFSIVGENPTNEDEELKMMKRQNGIATKLVPSSNSISVTPVNPSTEGLKLLK